MSTNLMASLSQQTDHRALPVYTIAVTDCEHFITYCVCVDYYMQQTSLNNCFWSVRRNPFETVLQNIVST